MLDVLRSGDLALGPMYRRFEEAFADIAGTAACRRLLERDGRPARQPGAAGRRPRRRGGHLVVLVRRVGQRDPRSSTRRRCSPTSTSRRSTSTRRRSRRRSRRARKAILPVHIFGYPCDIGAHQRDRGAPWPAGGRGRLRGAGRERGRAAASARRQPRRLRLLPEQADDDGRGRDDHDRRPATSSASCAASSTRAAPTTATGWCTSGSGSTSGWTRCPRPSGLPSWRSWSSCWPSGRGWPAATSSSWPASRASSCHTRGAIHAAGSSTTYGWPSTSTARR